MSTFLPGSAPVTEASEGRLGALLRALRRSEGFSFHVVVADGPARSEALRRLRAWTFLDGVPQLAILPGGEVGARRLEEAIHGNLPFEGGLIVADGDALVRAETPLHVLNVARDRLHETLGGPLVIVLSPAAEARLAREAPDLFDVRTGTYEIVADRERLAVSEPTPSPPEASTLSLESRALSLNEARIRASELRAWEGLDDGVPKAALSDSWASVAHAFHTSGDPAAAIEACEHALRLAESVGYEGGAAEAMRLAANARFASGPTDRIQADLRGALAIFTKLGDGIGQGKALLNLGSWLLLQGRREEALDAFEQSETLFSTAGDAHASSVALLSMTDALIGMGQLTQAQPILEHVVRRLGETGESHEQTIALIRLADILEQQGDLDTPLQFLNWAAEEFDRRGSIANLASVHLRIGGLHGRRGDVSLSIAALQEAEEGFRAINARRDRAVALGAMAFPLAQSGRMQDAIDAIDEGMRLHRELGDDLGGATLSLQLVDLLLSEGATQEALKHIESHAIPILHHLGGPLDVAGALLKKAACLRQSGNVEAGIDLLQYHVLPPLESAGRRMDLAIARAEMASLLVAKKQYARALRILEQDVVPAFEEAGALPLLTSVGELISYIHVQDGELDEGIAAYEHQILPAIGRLGFPRQEAAVHVNYAQALLRRGTARDREVATLALHKALTRPSFLSEQEQTYASRLLRENHLSLLTR